MTMRLTFLCALTAVLVGCHSSPPPAAEEVYVPHAGAVGVEIIRMGSTGPESRWLTTYTDGLRTTRFTIELEPATTAGGPGSPVTGKGKFVAETGSDPVPLLEGLKKALQAKRMPAHVEKADELAFNYLVVGEHQRRSGTGGFQAKPGGDWEMTKIFLANDQAQVYFNFNPVIHKAEFTIKDAEYGDRVLAELAKVF